MKVTIALLVLINAYFLNAASLPALENPCTPEGLYQLQYYYAYPGDETRYIECNPWGSMEVKVCPEGSKWNTWLSSCILPVPFDEKNATEQVTEPMTLSCAYYGNFTCQNGGICNQFLDESRCFCLSNFTAYFCQENKVSTGAFGQFINESFSLDLYKRQRPLSNDSLAFNTTFDVSLILDDATRQRVQKYLNMYPNGEMRFDTLINYLVQDFLSQLFPSSFFLREFTIEGEVDMGFRNAIPNILQAAKYNFDRFDNFFLIFEQVLDRLVEYLPKYMPKVKEEAQGFFEVYDMIFTKFSSMNNLTDAESIENRTELTRDEMRRQIEDDFNSTLSYSYDLFRYLNRFDDELSVRGENYTAEEMQYAIGNFSIDPETTRILSEIHMRTNEMWESLSFYGFWYVISSYVVIPEIDATSMKRPYVIDDKKPVFGALLGSEPEDVDGGNVSTSVLKLVSESLLSEITAALLGDDTFTTEDEHLIGKSTTVVPRVGQLVGESTTVTPRAGQLVGESTTTSTKASRLSTLTTTARNAKKSV